MLINPPFYVHAYLAACYARLGREEARIEAKRRLYEVRPDFDLGEFQAIFPYRNPDTAKAFFGGFEEGLA